MNINNYECDGQISIEDFLASDNQEVKHLLHSGQVVFEAFKGDVERHVVTDEHWYIEHLKTYGNRTMVRGAYGVVLDSTIGNRVFFEKEKAEEIAEIYLQNHEVIRASEINPVETVAYSYKATATGQRMLAFYSVLDNKMVYVKGFTTFEHKNVKSDIVAATNGGRLLRNAEIQNYISGRMEERQKRTEVTQDRVIQELAAIAFSKITDYAAVKDDMVKIKDTNELTENQIRAISGIKEGKFGIELKLNDKEKALELLGRHLGMWNDKLDIKTPAIDDSMKEMEAYFEQRKASGSGPPVE